MSELQKFAQICHELVGSSPTWLYGFVAEWVDSDGQAKFKLTGHKSTAMVEWTAGSRFKIRVVGPHIFYYESGRMIETAEEAIGCVSSLLCE